MKKREVFLGIILIIILLFIVFFVGNLEGTNKDMEDNVNVIDIVDDSDLSIKNNSKVKLNIKFANIFKSSNNFFDWESSNEDVASVDNGVVKAKSPGTTTVTAKLDNLEIKTKITVYDIKKVIIIIGDSRMDHFKDDNNFNSTSRYEIKYTDKVSMLSKYDRLYVVSLSGMRYEWFSGDGIYKENNATNYVKDIISEYEDKTKDTIKYDIKLLFNLGVNDLSHYHLTTTPSEVASKYLSKIDDVMNNEWKSDKIYNISLNMVTLFPVNDDQIKCYFPKRYNKDVIEFNDYITTNSKYTVCDAYNDLDFNDLVFRERFDNASCATRDGLHFSKEFNTTELYSYLVNVCANK